MIELNTPIGEVSHHPISGARPSGPLILRRTPRMRTRDNYSTVCVVYVVHIQHFEQDNMLYAKRKRFLTHGFQMLVFFARHGDHFVVHCWSSARCLYADRRLFFMYINTRLIEYGSTLYVGMARKKMAANTNIWQACAPDNVSLEVSYYMHDNVYLIDL